MRSYQSGDYTAITFVNGRRRPIVVNWVDGPGARKKLFRLLPGQSHFSPTQFNQAMLVTEDSGRPIGLYYPEGIPTTAVVTEKSGTPDAGPPHGFLMSDDPSRVPSQVKVASGADLSSEGLWPGWMSLLNLTAGPVSLYTVSPTGSSGFYATLTPGQLLSGGGQAGARYVVLDAHQHVIGLYETPPVDRVALILPRPRGGDTNSRGENGRLR
jgi:hypothetical protein